MTYIRKLVFLRIGVTLLVATAGCWLFNSQPVADFTATPATGPAPLIVHFDGSASTDPDGDVLTYQWSFGDGGSANTVSGFHTFNELGVYNIELVVFDTFGNESSMTRSILVTAPENELPTASFTAAPLTGAAPLTVILNAAASDDPDGSITSHEWDFGDSASGTGVSGTHTYTSQGAYIVTLTVKDNEDATDTATVAILVTAPGNQLPVASFTADPTIGFFPFDVDFDASASYDTDGTIIAYQWDFGDGDTGSGQTITHSYDSFGTFTVVLTVIDNTGAPASDVAEIRSLIFIIPIIIPPLFP